MPDRSPRRTDSDRCSPQLLADRRASTRAQLCLAPAATWHAPLGADTGLKTVAQSTPGTTQHSEADDPDRRYTVAVGLYPRQPHALHSWQ